MLGIEKIFGKRFARDAHTELLIALMHGRNFLNPIQRQKLKQLASQKDLCLHLGCGNHKLMDWVNVDAMPGGDIVWDLRRGLPFADGSAQFIFHEHLLEHLDYDLEVPAFLAECYRVLKPSGVMRVVVPDVERFVLAYQTRDMEWFEQVEPGRSFRTPNEGLAFNFQYEGQHHAAWDFETLAMRLKETGFASAERTGYRTSPIAELNLESDSQVRAIHSLCVNAVK